MKSYHFDIGNSSAGPLGFCARILANSKQEAMEILRTALAWTGDTIEVQYRGKLVNQVEYMNVYVNSDYMTVADIDDYEEAPAVCGMDCLPGQGDLFQTDGEEVKS